VCAVAEQIGDPHAVGFGVVRTAWVGAFPVPGPVRDYQLPAALSKDPLILEVGFTSDARPLRAAVDEHNPWTRMTPARDVNRRRAAHAASTLDPRMVSHRSIATDQRIRRFVSMTMIWRLYRQVLINGVTGSSGVMSG